MTHKHRWQFVKTYFDHEHEYQKEYVDEGACGYIIGFNMAEFICDCGKVKIVEVKR